METLYDSEILMKCYESNDCDKGDFWNGQCSKNKDFKDYQTINAKYFIVEQENGDVTVDLTDPINPINDDSGVGGDDEGFN